MEAKQQYYSLKEPWRLRVATAQAYSIIKNRDVGRYERVISILEASYRLLPTLVAAIKHMKIMFGLKTLVWTIYVVCYVFMLSVMLCSDVPH